MAGVDDFEIPVRQPEAEDLPRDELVGTGRLEERTVGGVGLPGRRRGHPSGVAQAPDGERRQERGCGQAAKRVRNGHAKGGLALKRGSSTTGYFGRTVLVM